MADIHDLEEERGLRELEKFLAADKGFKIDLDICGKQVMYTGHALGGNDPQNDRLGIIVYEVVGPRAQAIGALHIDRDQWEKLKAKGDALLSFREKPA